MSDIKRLQELLGRNPTQETTDQLAKDLRAITEAYTSAINTIKNGKQIDEGLFSNLIAALKTAGTVSKQGAKKVKAKVDALKSNVKELYQDNKAKEEVKELVKGLQNLLVDFETLSKKVPTVLKRDAEVAQEMTYFHKLFATTIETIAVRVAVAENLQDETQLHNYLVEHDIIAGDPILEVKSVDRDLIKEVMETKEYKDVVAVMKDISSNAQLNHGTFCFDTGLNSEWNDQVKTNTRYVLKIYADGWVRGELRRVKGTKLVSPMLGSHYRLGKNAGPIKGKDEVDMYRKAFVNILQRFQKKKARHSSESQLLANAYAEYQEKLMKIMVDSDAEPEEKIRD